MLETATLKSDFTFNFVRYLFFIPVKDENAVSHWQMEEMSIQRRLMFGMLSLRTNN